MKVCFFSAFCDEISEWLGKNGYSTLCVSCPEGQEYEALKTVNRAGVDGVVATATDRKHIISMYEQIPLPCVLVGARGEQNRLSSIDEDPFDAAKRIARQLVAEGCTRFFVLRTKKYGISNDRRTNGFLEGLTEAGVCMPRENIVEQEESINASLRVIVNRVRREKEKARLFEKEEDIQKDIRRAYDIKALATEVGEKCIKIVRNRENLLPLSLPEKAKILLINIAKTEEPDAFSTLAEELTKRGFIVKSLGNPKHYAVQKEIPEYDCILVNCKMTSYNYPGGSLRIGWEQVWPFWRGYIFTHPCVIFTSFGDPYKIYDFPYLRTYINAFSEAEGVQRGFVRVLLGETEPCAKSPVALKGFFDREV